jgi:hypothetical protein
VWRSKARKSLLFLKKKKQKDFYLLQARARLKGCDREARPKVFLLLFLQKKKNLPSSFYSPHITA